MHTHFWLVETHLLWWQAACTCLLLLQLMNREHPHWLVRKKGLGEEGGNWSYLRQIQYPNISFVPYRRRQECAVCLYVTVQMYLNVQECICLLSVHKLITPTGKMLNMFDTGDEMPSLQLIKLLRGLCTHSTTGFGVEINII